MLLNERSQSEKATYCVIPTIWRFGKCKTTETVKNLPAMHETGVRSLGWEDSLEKRMATDSSIHAWKIPGYSLQGGKRLTHTHTQRQKKRSVVARVQQEERDEQAEYRELSGQWNYSVWYYSGGHMSKPIEYMTPRMNPNVNCELWVIMMQHCRFINDHKCTLWWGCQEGGWGLPPWLNGKESTCQCRRHSLIPDPGRSPMPWSK